MLVSRTTSQQLIGGMCCKCRQAVCCACACMRRNRPALFRGRHFEAQTIVLSVRRYLRFGLSFRKVEELMVQRKVDLLAPPTLP